MTAAARPALTATDHVPTGKPCRRCSGSGVWAGRGICYACGGDGRARRPVERPMNAEELAAFVDYQHGLAFGEDRARDRAARRAARS